MRQQRDRARYAAIRPGWRESLHWYIDTVERSAGPGSRLLDVGCGHADVLAPLVARTPGAVGLDPDAAALARNTTLRRRVAGLAEALPFRDAAFDLVVSAWVLEHLAEPERAFAEVHRVLRPGGRLLCLTPNARHPVVWLNRAVPHRFHDALARRLYGRGARDTYPVRYRLNTPAALDRTLTRLGFVRRVLALNGDPTYLSFNEPLFRLACAAERLLDRPRLRPARVHLIAVYDKRR